MPRRCMDYMKNEVKTFPQSTAIGERERERERERVSVKRAVNSCVKKRKNFQILFRSPDWGSLIHAEYERKGMRDRGAKS
jgi:hypothetical protein